LKEKVSITAATVVGFLIAGTVAFGAATDVEFTTKSEGQVTVQVGKEGEVTSITGTKDSISVGQYKELLDNTEGNNNYNKNLAKLLTVETDENGVTTFASVVEEEQLLLGKVKATATTDGALTLIKTDDTYKSIISELTIEATGFDASNTATAMEAANSGDKVTNAGTITVNDYAVGMVAGAGAEAVNSVKEDKSAGITVNAGEKEANTAIGMLAETGATKSTTTLTNDGKIAVTKGIGISVTGDGEAEVTFGEAGIITVDDDADNIGINIAGTAKTSNTTITGGTIELKGAGIGINAKGNVTLKDIAITLSDETAGTGIKYDGGEKEAKAEISTTDIDVKASGATGIDATMSNQATSTLNIKTGSISTGNGATGIKIAGSSEGVEAPEDGVQKTTATVTTTLGETEGTGVDVIGKAYSGITVNIGDDNGTSTAGEALKTKVSGTGVNINSNEVAGKVVVNVNQSNLQVADTTNLIKVTANSGDVTINTEKAVELLEGANLVDIGDVGGNITVNLNAEKQKVVTGSLVNVGEITGTTNVNINKDVTFADKGNIVKVASDLGVGGVLNINLNVEGEKGLNVTAGNTALALSGISTEDKAFVKNTGTVTIEGNGTLVKGNDANTISLSNQGLINVNAIDATTSTNSSHISSGKAVNVANYGIIKLEISSTDFLDKYNNGKREEQKVTDLKDLTIEQVRATLVELGIIESDSEGTFTSLGNIEFAGGAVYTTGEELTSNVEVGGLITTLEKSESRAFKIIGGKDIELTAKNDDVELENVQFNIEKGTLKIEGATPVAITNAKDAHILNIGEKGQLAVADGATLNYSGTISAKNGNTVNAAIAVTDAGTLTLANGALNMVAPESKTALLSEPANRVGIELTGAGTTELDNYTVNADIKGTLDGGNALQGTLSAKGKSRITGNVTDIKDIKVTDNGMLTFGANSVINTTTSNAAKATIIDLANGNMGVEIGEKGKNVLYNTTVGDIAFNNLVANTPQDAKSGKIVLLTNALTENTEFNLGKHKLEQEAVVANGDIYYNITQGNGGIWNATFNKDGLIDKTGYKYMELNDMYVATQ
ncbi:autotransporter domain-containing protein, partial [Fusobacterium varium]|uniref:beta strand repeat-containing protein n=1 Tax=Fusobacterium varium TaxID=856 RepID=UPI002E1C3E41|nr:autotransporter domain-containing protein [Fusobacterium varium]